ncbi:MAG: hypothetical protein IPO21_19595 [Bacteroidales bacterium]|nr:hypothetical protein [Bacteroidales bacterium]
MIKGKVTGFGSLQVRFTSVGSVTTTSVMARFDAQGITDANGVTSKWTSKGNGW